MARSGTRTQALKPSLQPVAATATNMLSLPLYLPKAQAPSCVGSILFLASFPHVQTVLVPAQLPPPHMESDAAAFTRRSINIQGMGTGPQLYPQWAAWTEPSSISQTPFSICISKTAFVWSVVELLLLSMQSNYNRFLLIFHISLLAHFNLI